MNKRDVSNASDYLDVRDIIARFEELEDERDDWNEEPDDDFPVKVLDEDDEPQSRATCGTCGRSWDDAIPTAYTPTPSARCPFEAFHGGAWETENPDEAEELATLKALLEELEGNGGDERWRGSWYPITLIRDSYFVEAMKELVEDIGDMPKGFPAYLEIDWNRTAENLRADYSSVEFGDVTYWYR